MELLGPGDLALVAAACPALERFWAIAAVQKDAQLADLAKMTSVTQLAIGGNHLEAAELAAAVAKMTQLQDLSVVGMPDFGPTAAAPLTQLTALRRLRLWACYMEDCTFACEELLTSKASPPDVWRKLRILCLRGEEAPAIMLQLLEAQNAHDRACWLGEKQSLQAQLADAQGMVGSLQQQLASLQQQLAAARAQNLQLQEQLGSKAAGSRA